MGGDNAPQMIVRGALIATKRYPQARFIMVGDKAQLDPLIDRRRRLRNAVDEVVHTEEVVRPDEKPSTALRAGRGSSMRLAIDQVKEGRADAVVSAGNTGALMAMSKFVLKTIAGVDRPAISSFFPTMKGETAMLDLGANVQCDTRNLVEFAVMGCAFSRSVLGLTKPTVGLLNVGSEQIKGHEALQEAAERLRAFMHNGQFKGFIEGDDIAKGSVDVVVTDGFTGNIALKTAEGTAALYTKMLRGTFKHSLLASLGYLLARPAMMKLRKRVDPRRYNGAVFLGLNGIVVKSHGGTDALGFAHAIGVAVDLATHGYIQTIKSDLEELTASVPAPPIAPRAAVL